MTAKTVYTFSDWQHWSAATAGIDPPFRLAVFGDPVAHSASPPMHRAALENCGIAARYGRVQIRPAELSEALRLLVENGFIGTNLTIPHKQAALGLMDEVDEHARIIGAVNTVAIREGKRVGFNTDGPGIVRALRAEFGVELRDLRVLLLGAGGGAGRAIAVQCALEKCQRLVLVNRTFAKAAGLAAELQSTMRLAAGVEAVPWEEEVLRAQLEHIDLVINATSVGLNPADAPPIAARLLPPRVLVYDTIYTAAKTPLQLAAQEAGARSANGLSMLLHQGALSFQIWFDREPPLEAMRAALLEFARNR